MDVLARFADRVQEEVACHHDWGQLWSKSRHDSSTLDSFVAELGSTLEDALVLLSTSASHLDGSNACSLQSDEESPEFRGKEKTPNTAFNEQSPLESSNLSCTGIMASHPARKLLSAMKGSREKQGIQVGKLSVKWASDVYDPPTTTQSHTVKSNNPQCSATYKKNYRNKNKYKAKPQRNRKNGRGSSRAGSY